MSIRRAIGDIEFEYEWSEETRTWHFHADGITGGGQETLHGAIQASRDALAFSKETSEREKALGPAVAAMPDDLLEATAGLLEELRQMLELGDESGTWICVRDREGISWEAKDFPFIAAALHEKEE